MIYLLDTNVVIGMIARKPKLLARVHAHRPGDYAIPSIVYHELCYGAFNGNRPAHNLEGIEELRFTILDFDRTDARVAGEIRARLRAEGRPIGPYDVLIAGQALARDLTLVTNNTAEFARVDGLRTEDW